MGSGSGTAKLGNAISAAEEVAGAAGASPITNGGGSSSGSGGQVGATQPGGATLPGTSTAPVTTTLTGSTAVVPPARPAALELVARGGSVWLSVRAGSATGKVLFQSTLPSGRHVRFARRRIWVRVGAPWNLAVTAAGHRLAVPLRATGDMLVTAAGVRAAA